MGSSFTFFFFFVQHEGEQYLRPAKFTVDVRVTFICFDKARCSPEALIARSQYCFVIIISPVLGLLCSFLSFFSLCRSCRYYYFITLIILLYFERLFSKKILYVHVITLHREIILGAEMF